MRLGVALGGRPETFMGLAGAGDLILTCTGDLSRNRRVGLALGRGERLDAILAQLGHVAEGVYTAREVDRLARERVVDMPITREVCAVLFEGRAPAEAVEQLLGRDPRGEKLTVLVLVLERELHPDAVGDHLAALDTSCPSS